ncbi:MAG: hypothetical protein OXI74_00330, partial [Rhodospirillaceae bacterium]|nr:hypothetical protein [Rhodospirillaceae bacterium]
MNIDPSKRSFLKAATMAGAGSLAATLGSSTVNAQQPPPSGAAGLSGRVRMAGYSPSTTSFSRGLTHIGDRLES